MKIVAGLGNPGAKYRNTRHNTGFRVVDKLAARAGDDLSRRRFQGRTAVVRIGGERVLLLKPGTYMNLSGRSLGPAANFYNVEVNDILVVLDDVDLPLGALRARARGGAGGHNGMKSIIAVLGTDAVPRLRVGIGRAGAALAGHVLAPFSEDEAAVMEDALDRACDAVALWAAEGVHACMNRFNQAADNGGHAIRRNDGDGKQQ